MGQLRPRGPDAIPVRHALVKMFDSNPVFVILSQLAVHEVMSESGATGEKNLRL